MQAVLSRIRASESAPPWSTTSAIVFAVVYGVIWIAAQALAVSITGGDLTTPTASGLALGVLITGALSAIVVVQWVQRRAPQDWSHALHLETSHTLPLFVCLLLGIGAAWGIDLIGVLLHLKGDQVVPPTLAILADQSAPAFGWIVAAVAAILGQPIGEELIFRGLLYPSLAARFDHVGSIALTTAIFTVINVLLGGSGVWYALIQPLLMSLVVTALRAHTQSTQMAIVARAMFGLFFVLSALISAHF